MSQKSFVSNGTCFWDMFKHYLMSVIVWIILALLASPVLLLVLLVLRLCVRPPGPNTVIPYHISAEIYTDPTQPESCILE